MADCCGCIEEHGIVTAEAERWQISIWTAVINMTEHVAAMKMLKRSHFVDRTFAPSCPGETAEQHNQGCYHRISGLEVPCTSGQAGMPIQ